MSDGLGLLWSQWRPVLSSTGMVAAGLQYTAIVTIAAFLLALVGGMLLALLRMSKVRWLQRLAYAITQICRSLSAFVYVLFIYFGLPAFLGINIAPLTAGIIALTILNSAYMAEIFRSAVANVGVGQVEAAACLGLQSHQAFIDIILPQAVRLALPSLVSQFIVILKDSSVIGVIGISDIMYRASLQASLSYKYFQYYTLVGLMYVTVVFALSLMGRWLERRLQLPH